MNTLRRVKSSMDAVDAAAWGLCAWGVIKLLKPLVGAAMRSPRQKAR